MIVVFNVIQSALVISNSKGLSEIYRDTRTSTYQNCRIEKKNLTTECPIFISNLTPLHKIYILKLLFLKSISPLIHNIFYLLLSFYVRTGTRISLRDKRLFEITEVETARVDCIWIQQYSFVMLFYTYCQKIAHELIFIVLYNPT